MRDADRELLMLVGMEGLTPSEAARVLGISAVTSRTRLHRARRRLSSRLSERSEIQNNEMEIQSEMEVGEAR
jgi:DNA-directed RNA polymerase specialized sigma24 family protein